MGAGSRPFSASPSAARAARVRWPGVSLAFISMRTAQQMFITPIIGLRPASLLILGQLSAAWRQGVPPAGRESASVGVA